MSIKWRVTSEILKSGQPRPYADSQYVGRLTIEWQGMTAYKNPDAPFIPNGGLLKGAGTVTVKKFVQAFIHDFVDDKKEGNWASPRLDYIKEVEPGVYEARIVLPYTD